MRRGIYEGQLEALWVPEAMRRCCGEALQKHAIQFGPDARIVQRGRREKRGTQR
jgi:hypothetical protein